MSLPDLQSQPDHRALAIDAVGIRRLRHPVLIRSGAGVQPAIATFDLAVALPASERGTHMSRFVELIEECREPLDAGSLRRLVAELLRRLEANDGEIDMRFTHFRRKAAPVSGAESLLDHDVRWRGRITADGRFSFRMTVTTPVTSLCPCSKEISVHGAHNQRSLITIDVETAEFIEVETLVRIAECAASCEVYGLLKRPDEKFVTERAYENPKFVEDLVRDVAIALSSDARVRSYAVEAENFESIHNHSAWARLTGPAAVVA